MLKFEPAAQQSASLLRQRISGVPVDASWSKEAHKAAVAKNQPFVLMPCALMANVYCLTVLLHAATHGTVRPLRLLVSACLTFVFMDLVSGVLHLILDNPLFLHTPGLKGMCLGFQQHHANPSLIYKMDLQTHLRPMAAPATIVYVVGAGVHGFDSIAFCVGYVCASLCLVWMQLSHRWAHMPRQRHDAFTRTLITLRVVIQPAQHGLHHLPPYLSNFCILNGLCNPLLNQALRLPHCSPHSRIWLPAFVGLVLAYILLSPVVTGL